ncbi:MAG: hypothetical protein SGCHY_001442 [Lobulomycetales sp.]
MHTRSESSNSLLQSLDQYRFGASGADDSGTPWKMPSKAKGKRKSPGKPRALINTTDNTDSTSLGARSPLSASPTRAKYHPRRFSKAQARSLSVAVTHSELEAKKDIRMKLQMRMQRKKGERLGEIRTDIASSHSGGVTPLPSTYDAGDLTLGLDYPLSARLGMDDLSLQSPLVPQPCGVGSLDMISGQPSSAPLDLNTLITSYMGPQIDFMGNIVTDNQPEAPLALPQKEGQLFYLSGRSDEGPLKAWDTVTYDELMNDDASIFDTGSRRRSNVNEVHDLVWDIEAEGAEEAGSPPSFV